MALNTDSLKFPVLVRVGKFLSKSRWEIVQAGIRQGSKRVKFQLQKSFRYFLLLRMPLVAASVTLPLINTSQLRSKLGNLSKFQNSSLNWILNRTTNTANCSKNLLKPLDVLTKIKDGIAMLGSW